MHFLRVKQKQLTSKKKNQQQKSNKKLTHKKRSLNKDMLRTVTREGVEDALREWWKATPARTRPPPRVLTSSEYDQMINITANPQSTRPSSGSSAGTRQNPQSTRPSPGSSAGARQPAPQPGSSAGSSTGSSTDSPVKVKSGHPRTPKSDAPTEAEDVPAKSDTSTHATGPSLAGLGTHFGDAGGSFIQFYVSNELMRRARDRERENDLMREREMREERERGVGSGRRGEKGRDRKRDNDR